MPTIELLKSHALIIYSALAKKFFIKDIHSGIKFEMHSALKTTSHLFSSINSFFGK
jgi:hypothetical protein